MSPSLLENLPPRPPTPPRETHNNVLVIASIDARNPSVHTPPGINSPTSATTTHSTSRRRKRVEFSAKAQYKDPPVYPDGVTHHPQNPTPVSLPRSASKPVKSILKPTNYESNPLDAVIGDANDPTGSVPGLAAMLESSIQMLAGGDRSAKIDAYSMLARALRASNDVPDRAELSAKMGLLMQFMQRDITFKTPDGNLDTSLVNHALTFLKTLLGFPKIAPTITNDFGVFIMDHCIRSFEDPSVPKDVARHLMQVISLQNFSNKVMTSDRVGRLVTSLRHIEEHLQGKSIIMSRVSIYRKLIKQVRPLMVAHSEWLIDLFTDMLSTWKDIRNSAIALGFEAAYSSGHEKQLSRKAMEIFKTTSEDQQYIEYYEDRLNAMAKEKYESPAVPQIWSVVILILRIRLGEWDRTRDWLSIIQVCFNSNNLSTKLEANHAWNRMAYLLQGVDDTLSTKNLSTLTSPLIMQLKRKGPHEELRKTIFGSICNLIYYTFKPNTSPALLDQYWDINIKPTTAKLLDPNLEPKQEYLHYASAVLSGLFDCTTSRLWKVDRIVSSALVKPEELPAIDSKWIRRNASRVFATVQPILERDFLALADKKSPAYKLWQSLVATVASAASKEIKVSKDTATFVTEAFNVLQVVWKRGVQAEQNSQQMASQFLLATSSFLDIMVSSLGLLPFTEKTGKVQAHVKAPLYQLFSTLSFLPPGIPDDKDLADFFALVFAPFFTSKGRKAKTELAQEMLHAIPMDAPRPYGPWVLVAGTILDWLEPTSDSHQSTTSGSENPVGHEYRDVVKVLERGIKSTPNLPWSQWELVFCSLYKRARDETGDAGVAIAIVEPLAKVVLEQVTQHSTGTPSVNAVRCITELMTVARHPRDKQAVEAARRRLWGTILAGPRSASFDPFDNFYKAVNETLLYLYENFGSGVDAAVFLLKEIGVFFDRCNCQLFLKTMLALQDGILPWLEDTKRHLGSHNDKWLNTVQSLWEKLCTLLADTDKRELQLETLDRLFCATLLSSHRCIAGSSISLWNRLFEESEHLDYSDKLKEALAKVQPHADIVVPGLELSSAEYSGQQPPFMDSPEDYSLPKMPHTRGSRRSTPVPSMLLRSESPRSSKFGELNKLGEVTPKVKLTRANRPKTKPRLRHDDSQIQFAVIEPSSVGGNEMESQVLTERQKEVRERQKETTALFPEICSSPGMKSKDAKNHILPSRMSSPGKGSQHDQDKISLTPEPLNSQGRIAVTPEPDAGYNDYVSSTPTPRRGQLIPIPDHDMMDPPSSPPEPRGNPLAAEIRSRSASNSLLDDWQFSSSPISGSPNPARQEVISELTGPGEDITMSDSGEDLPQSQYDAGMMTEEVVEPMIDNEVIEESIIMNTEAPRVSPTIFKLDPIGPQTPSKNTRSAHRQETPKSDTEVFVDAPTSPLTPSPRRTERMTRSVARSTSALANEVPAAPVINNTSFNSISDLDETSLLRLVVELDAGKLDPTEYDRASASTASPHKTDLSQQQEVPRAVSPRDCIVVGDSPTKRPVSSQASRRNNRSSSAAVPCSDDGSDASQATSRGRRGKRGKRKRTLSKIHDAAEMETESRIGADAGGGKKLKAHHGASPGSSFSSTAGTGLDAEVPDSQPTTDNDNQEPAQAATTAVVDHNHDDRITKDRGVTIPSSLPEEASQQSSVSTSLSVPSEEEEHRELAGADGDVQMGDVVIDGEDDQDADVQSQIALELSQSQSQQEDEAEEVMEMDGKDKDLVLQEEENDDENDTTITDNSTEKEMEELSLQNQETGLEEPRGQESPRPVSPVKKLMDFFHGSLDILRSARLSRQEVSEIEDVFMDMKRELYNAESRGRERSRSVGSLAGPSGEGASRPASASGLAGERR
ncbi:telomere length regulator protein rif1 [Rhypophila decipiens]|uniref:Telomere length regulator protein rif1 n=1 Tax=Rhypophila decipiens TaxID=261697 RepID=A0AAN6YJD5_9PEZI|nr:telomere length regulator protein rif1 [Rhypophila decipiens]